MKHLSRVLNLLMALSVALSAACTARRPAGAFTIAVRTANDHAPFYIADHQQLYRQRGLDVTVRLVPNNTEIIEALQRGDVQVGVVPVTTAIAAIAAGGSLHIVAMTGRGSDGLLVRTASGLASLESLRGKKIATIRASILDVLLRHALTQAGLDPERDVQLVYMQQLGDLITVLKTGQVDACSNTEPFMTDAERQGWGHILTYYTASWPSHPCCVVVARDEWAQRSPAALRDVLAVHCQAVDWANANPDETAQIIVDYMHAYDAALVRESLDPSRMTIDYQLDPAEIERMADLMVEQGLIERSPAVSRLVQVGPLREVLRRR